MNIKIYNKLQEMVKQSPVMLTNPQSLKAVVSAVFGVEVPNKIEGGIIELTYIIDALIMENYFAKVFNQKPKRTNIAACLLLMKLMHYSQNVY